MIQISDERLIELITTDKTTQELYALASLKCGWSVEQFLTELVVGLANDKRNMTEYAFNLVCQINGIPRRCTKSPPPEYLI